MSCSFISFDIKWKLGCEISCILVVLSQAVSNNVSFVYFSLIWCFSMLVIEFFIWYTNYLASKAGLRKIWLSLPSESLSGAIYAFIAHSVNHKSCWHEMWPLGNASRDQVISRNGVSEPYICLVYLKKAQFIILDSVWWPKQALERSILEFSERAATALHDRPERVSCTSAPRWCVGAPHILIITTQQRGSRLYGL